MTSVMSPIGSACLARQSIYDVGLIPCGYELLYRSGASAGGSGAVELGSAAETAMSASTLTGALTDIGLDAIVGDRPAWVNVGDAFLIDDLAAALPPQRTVIEVLETTAATAGIVGALTRLREEGYRLALDDFVFRPELESLLEIADVVKVDVLSHTEDELEQQVQLLHAHNVQLLAEKVETHEPLARCRELGFTLFQG